MAVSTLLMRLKLQTRIERELKQTYENSVHGTKCSRRHPERPRVNVIIGQLFDDFTPLAGDRNYAEDCAVIGGMARYGQGVMVMGTEKGSTTDERINGILAWRDLKVTARQPA